MENLIIFKDNVMQFLKLFCIWECGSSYTSSDIDDHELKCEMAPFQECPICVNFAAPFEDMRKYLLEYHKKDVKVAGFSALYLSREELQSTLILLNQHYYKFDGFEWTNVTGIWIDI